MKVKIIINYVIAVIVVMFVVHVIYQFNVSFAPVDIDYVLDKYGCLNDDNLHANGDNKFILKCKDGTNKNLEWKFSETGNVLFDFFNIYFNRNFFLFDRATEFNCNNISKCSD